MQSRKDGALRKIVEDERLPMKTRREALGEMEAPSRAFLTALANNPSVPAKLRLDAARRLPATEQRLSEERTARAHRRSEPDEEARRREIDEVLRQAAQEFGVNVDDPRGSKTIPVSGEPQSAGPPPAAAGVPVDGVSSEVVSPPESEQSAVRIPDSNDSESRRAEGLKRGHELAAAILTQLGVMSHAPLNWHAGQKKLEQLQVDFIAWERAMHADYPGINTQKEFPDARLRPSPKIIDARTYQAHRRVMTLDEALAVPLAEAKPTQDDGFWTGMPAGI